LSEKREGEIQAEKKRAKRGNRCPLKWLTTPTEEKKERAKGHTCPS